MQWHLDSDNLEIFNTDLLDLPRKDVHCNSYVSGTYFCVNMALITLSSFLAVIVINTHIRGDRTNAVPRWLKRVNKNFVYAVKMTVVIAIHTCR